MVYTQAGTAPRNIILVRLQHIFIDQKIEDTLRLTQFRPPEIEIQHQNSIITYQHKQKLDPETTNLDSRAQIDFRITRLRTQSSIKL